MPSNGSKPQPPWWMVLLAGTYAGTFVLIFQLIIWGPAQLRGIVATFENGAMVIQSVAIDSVAAEGGLRVGDRVVSIDGRPMRRPPDWTAATGNWKAEHAHRWLVSRGDRQVELAIVPRPATVQGRLSEGYDRYLIHALSGFLLGLLVAWKRPDDPVARLGAWFLLTASIAFGLPQGWAVAWRELPEPYQLALWIPQISRFVLEGIFLSFFFVFPRRLFHSRWPWLVLWLPVLATLPWRIASFNQVIHPGQGFTVPAWGLQAGFARTIVYLVAGIVVLAVTYYRVLDFNEKRRVRVLMLGTGASATSAIVMVWFDSFHGRSLSVPGVLILSLAATINSTFFFSLAYAILRHRVLEISFIIRRGLQYALARGAIVGAVPALASILVLDLALNSHEPLATILRNRGWVYGALGAFVLVAYRQREVWLDALDRRFFRERYNAQRVLRDVVDEIRQARNFEEVAPRVVARIETALHPEFAAVMVREANEPLYRSLASFPVASLPFSISGESKLVALLRALEKPLEGLCSSSEWLSRRLPLDEIETVRHARVDLLVPIVMASGEKEALLAIGVKRSEEPYAREDQELLEAIASSLGLLLERRYPVRKLANTFEECPECGVCYESRSVTCNADGAPLKPVNLPRTLAGRYHLAKLLGRGGMGTVYEAEDSALMRRVAVKVIREDWAGSSEAVERFRREARAAAGFAHPNVVTVHDYGVEAGTRGFLVMELLDGATLRDELRKCRQLGPERTLELFRGVCAAVDAAHRRQLLHRDLKPENIFIVRPGSGGDVVKVLDFGIAKAIGPADEDETAGADFTTHAGALIGTPAYMSPEQLLGEKPGVQWDVWALAVVAYESLTGALPFPATCSPRERHSANPPREWQAFFDREFSQDRGRRAATALEFLDRLEAEVRRELR